MDTSGYFFNFSLNQLIICASKQTALLRYLTYDDSEMMEVNVLNIYGKTAS